MRALLAALAIIAGLGPAAAQDSPAGTALHLIRPGAQWDLGAGPLASDCSNLKWLDQVQAAPSCAALQAAITALAASPSTAALQIASTSTPALNGTYAIDATAQQLITSESVYIQATTAQGAAKFSNGQATKAWLDTAGAPHTFTTVQFISFAEAVAQYVDQYNGALASIAGGQSPTWPSQPVTIP